jgi:aminoglycoside 6'-N-acetyltransferase
MPPEPDYNFRLVTRDDLPMLRAWLGEPHVMRWWGDPDEQIGLITRDIDEPAMKLWIVSVAGRPFAYAQSYDPHAFGILLDQPPGTCGVDPFIGLPDHINVGHGSRFLAALCQRLFAAGAPRVIIDPDVDNRAAIRAYEKAGFRRIDERILDGGLVVFMAQDPAGDTR